MQGRITANINANAAIHLKNIKYVERGTCGSSSTGMRARVWVQMRESVRGHMLLHWACREVGKRQWK